MKYIILFLNFFALSLSLHAIDEPDLSPVDMTVYPTYAALLETELPVADRYDLARRFLGFEALSVQNAARVERAIGDRDDFYMSITSAGRGETVTAELKAIGEHIYIWLEDGVNASEETLSQLTNSFDTEVYEFVRTLWGAEALGIDGEERLHILISPQMPQGIGGYFSASNQYPSSLVPFSNERDMLLMSSLNLLPNYFNAGISTAAHEFQHLIHEQRDSNEDVWLNEGFSMLTEHLLNYGTSNFFITAFAGMPSTQLNAWGQTDNRLPSYGAAMLYLVYLHDRFGLEAVQSLHVDKSNGFIAVNRMLNNLEAPDADIIFADWVMANLLRQNGGNYGYLSLPDNLARMSTAAPIFQALPQSQNQSLSPYSSHYYQIANPPENLTISLTMPETIPLIPTTAASDDWFWYSQRGDNSNPRLTRAFDLRNLESAELSYGIWHSLEENWDYAYLSISQDGGQTWEIQTTPNMNNDNPHGRAYGAGYTGDSGDWIEETINLEAYLGQEILVRFEMLTDDSVNHEGIALDSMRLEALGYEADFENDDGGWQAEGWIQTDNRLPLRAWLQVAQHQGTEAILSRYLAEDETSWTISIAPETTLLTIAISPFAPMTTESMNYNLRLE